MRPIVARSVVMTVLAFALGMVAEHFSLPSGQGAAQPIRFTGPPAPTSWADALEQVALFLDRISPRPMVIIGALIALLIVIAMAAVLSRADAWLSAVRASPARQTPPQSYDAVATAELGYEIANLLKVLRSYLEANSRFANSLDRAQTSLGQSSTPDQVWNIVKLLMAENETIRSDARKLKTQLEVSHEYIEQLRSNLARAEEAALLDPLTGVGNRRRFDTDLVKAVDSAHAGRAPLCLMLADMDDFARHIERFGHALGDEVLKLFTGLLVQNVKGRDRIARFDGEGFAILLPNTAMGNAYHLTQQIRSQLQHVDWIGDRTGEAGAKLTASFGIAQLRDGDSAQALLRRADAKLCEAKRGGSNQIVIERSIAA